MGEIRRLLAGLGRGLQKLLARLLSSEIHQCAFRLLQRGENRALVERERSLRARVSGFDSCVNAAQIKRCPRNARSKVPGVRSAFAQPGEGIRFEPYASDECYPGKQVGSRNPDPGRGSSERTLHGADVRTTTQQRRRGGDGESRHYRRQRVGDRKVRCESGWLL